jgi:hypothetical protein
MDVMEEVIALELEPAEYERYLPLHRQHVSTTPNIRLAATESTDDDVSYRHKVAVAMQDANRYGEEISSCIEGGW